MVIEWYSGKEFIVVELGQKEATKLIDQSNNTWLMMGIVTNGIVDWWLIGSWWWWWWRRITSSTPSCSVSGSTIAGSFGVGQKQSSKFDLCQLRQPWRDWYVHQWYPHHPPSHEHVEYTNSCFFVIVSYTNKPCALIAMQLLKHDQARKASLGCLGLASRPDQVVVAMVVDWRWLQHSNGCYQVAEKPDVNQALGLIDACGWWNFNLSIESAIWEMFTHEVCLFRNNSYSHMMFPLTWKDRCWGGTSVVLRHLNRRGSHPGWHNTAAVGALLRSLTFSSLAGGDAKTVRAIWPIGKGALVGPGSPIEDTTSTLRHPDVESPWPKLRGVCFW